MRTSTSGKSTWDELVLLLLRNVLYTGRFSISYVCLRFNHVRKTANLSVVVFYIYLVF